MHWWFVYCLFWNSGLGVAGRTILRVRVEFEDSFWSNCFQESEQWAFFLSPETFRFWDLEWSAQISLCLYDHLVLRRSPDWPDVQSLAEDFPSRSTSCVTPSWLISLSLGPLVLALPSVNPHGKSLLDLSLTWRSAFRSERKLTGWLQENLEKLSMLNKRRRWFHSSREKLSLVRMSASWFLVSTYLIWLWVLTRVSLFDFVLQYHLDDSFFVFRKCRTEAHPEENVCWRERNPHIAITQPLAFSFKLMFWFCFCWRNGLLSRTSLLGLVCFKLQCWLWNVTLQSQCPKSREQANHPCAIQHPTKRFQTL